MTAAFDTPPPAELADNVEVEVELPLLLDAAAAAALLGVSTDKLYGWRRRGVIPYHRIESRFYFDRAELLEWWSTTLAPPRQPNFAARLRAEQAEARARVGRPRRATGVRTYDGRDPMESGRWTR